MGKNDKEQDQPLTLLEVASSVLAAAFGVQSKEKKQRDFTHGKPLQFVIVGVVFTLLFLVTVISIVNIVLK
ncbi:DUF2970 domain-containing protein [Oceanicoccus sp. KOV_DT_Chl]|uniref:DUF2970 domain-containing protein n=1 Tax=Oceanicoccus sp. KOV_DT_Chl TaxID=1904639 RepID=UPI000C7C8C46|nr:DUF2970 domain-containing protein [Oceanicoccus sp. KOV_DT_Chl]